MSFQVNADGALVQIQEVPVDEASTEAQLLADTEAAQNEVNTHTANLANAEEISLQAETTANAAADEVENHKKLLEVATASLEKSATEHASFTAARELRDAGVGADAEEATDSESDGAEAAGEPVSEAVDVPVNVLETEPAAG